MWGGAGGAALCAGCLAGGRRLRSVSGHRPRQLLRSILEEEPVVRCDDSSVPLCWECSARLAQAVSFTHQVKTCYRTLHDFCAQNLNQPLVAIARPPRLRICVQHSENIAPGATDTDQHIVKTEVTDDWQWTTKEENNVKNELDTVSVISASERNSTANSFTLSDEEELKYLIDKTEPSADHKRKHPKTKRLSVEEPSKTKQLSTITAKTKVKKKKRYKIKCQMVKMTFEEMMQEREDLRTSDAFLSAVFKCEKCLVTFDDSDALEQHVKSKHSPEQGAFSCMTCACLFRTETELQCHGVRHLRRYVCCMCGSRHASKKQAAQHCCANVISSDGAYQSKKSKSLKEQTDMKVDISEDSETKNPDELVLLEESLDKESSGPRSTSSYPCDLCAKVFRWKTSLRKHAELHRIQSGEKKTPYCDACRLSFTTTSNLQKHMKTSSKHQIQLKVRNLSDLLAEHPEQPKLDQTRIEDIKSSVKNSLTKFPCPHCDKKFQWKGNLLRHIQSHKARASGELYCAPCDRKFSSIATYQQHMKISKKHVSENEFRYMCSECGKKFSNKTRLKDHVDWEHLKNYTHKCPLCQKVFKSHTSLYLHKQVVHRKDDGDHLCDHCGKPFPNRAKLRSHIIAMHTTEQPYKCKLCPASFSWHSCLSRHVKVVHHKVKTKRKRKNKEELMSAANADLV